MKQDLEVLMRAFQGSRNELPPQQLKQLVAYICQSYRDYLTGYGNVLSYMWHPAISLTPKLNTNIFGQEMYLEMSSEKRTAFSQATIGWYNALLK